jgi:hypothetical protein
MKLKFLIIAAMVVVSIWGTIIYVAWHFIAKYW